MFKKVLIGLVALIAVLSAVIALQPEDFSISRSATINAAPQTVFTQVNNLHNWNAWSPWAKLDPNATNSFEGPEAGKGAIMRWDGNNDVGAGSMTITESVPAERIKMDLAFIRPMEGTNQVEFTFKPEGKGTVVSWTMSGKNNFIAKAINLVVDCEKMVGGMFEQGLSQLKAVAEGSKAG